MCTGNNTKATDGKGIITVDRVSKWYGQVIALNDITLHFDKGITGLLGPNGAGKSTLLKVITGQIRPRLGDVKVTGCNVWNNQELWRRMGYCPEQDTFWDELTGLQFVAFLLRLHGMSRAKAEPMAENAIELVGLQAQADRKIRGYSKGMRQRIKVAQCLAHEPDILILDEPLWGTDPLGRHAMIELFHRLEAEGKTLVVSSHVLEEVERITDNILLIHRGRLLAEGRIEEIRDLIDKHPHNIYIQTDDVEKLARRLIQEPFVLSVQKQAAPKGLYVQTHQPEVFYTQVPKLIVAERIELTHMSSQDDNLDAVFRYLVG